MVIYQKKKGNLSDAEVLLGLMDKEVSENQGDRWTFVAVLPESGFIHTVHSAERTSEEAKIFVEKIKAKSDKKAPLFMSDCWFYANVLMMCYCIYIAVVYQGRGRPAHPKQVVDPNLRYVQVHKKRDSKGKMQSITTRIMLGDEVTILNQLEDAKRSKTVNTDYVESRNGKYRKDNARLIRRTLCHSKKAIYHDAHIIFLTNVFNYTRTIDALKVLINPDAEKFKQKYQHRTPAMAEGLIGNIMTIKQLLCIRPIIVAA